MAYICLRLTAGALVGVLAAAFLYGPADARPLKKQACDALATERAKLARQGVEKAILKGPEWTQANMSSQTLELVRRYLDIEDKLRFRCRGVKLPDLVSKQSASLAESPDSPKKKTLKPKKIPKKTKQKPAPPLPEKKAVIAKPEPAVIKLPPVAAAKQDYLPSATTGAVAGEASPADALAIPLPDRRPSPAAVYRARAAAKKKTTKKKATTIQDTIFRSDSD